MEKYCKRGGHSPRAAFLGVMEKVLQNDRPFSEGGFFGGNGKSVAKGAAAEKGVRSRRPTHPPCARVWVGVIKLCWRGGLFLL